MINALFFVGTAAFLLGVNQIAQHMCVSGGFNNPSCCIHV